jgi:tRNA dimethylallyltransferase
MTPGPPLVVLAGATATGKTGLSIELAERLAASGRQAEVISADSRQVFRGLDIGTAKVTIAERRGVVHHGLDLVDPDQPFSLADFVGHATTTLADLERRGAVAILAGGTGLYLRAVARGLDTASLPSDAIVRARLEAELDTAGLDPLVARLIDRAPRLAAGVDLRNPRRVVRALEIAELQGDAPRPMARGYPGPVIWLGSSTEPTEHRLRIGVRARRQFEDGLLEEAVGLRSRFDPALPAFSAIGYREAWAHLDGELDLDTAADLVTRRTIAFAKRQATWFRAEPDIEWYDATDPTTATRMFERVSGWIG